jgi:cytochrome c biogenesis protein CcmG/thiol:disulfide interchange protein DsbE
VRRAVIAFALLLLAASCGGAPTTGDIDDGTPGLLEARLEQLEGKPVVVNYWATWCLPCKNEMPHIVDFAKRFEGRVEFVGVNVQDNAEAAADFVKEYGMTFRSIADPKGEIRRAERLLGLPATQFYDAEGELAFLKQGEIKRDELEEKIEDVLAASASA